MTIPEWHEKWLTDNRSPPSLAVDFCLKYGHTGDELNYLNALLEYTNFLVRVDMAKVLLEALSMAADQFALAVMDIKTMLESIKEARLCGK